MKFFFKSSDQIEHGPADLEEIRTRIRSGGITTLTMLRVSGSQTWEYASDLAELQECFRPGSSTAVGDFELKCLRELQVKDLPELLLYLFGKVALWTGLAFCVPAAFFALAAVFVLLDANQAIQRTMGHSIIGGSSGLLFPMVALLWSAIAPIAVLAAFWKKLLNVPQFIACELIVYNAGALGFWIWLLMSWKTLIPG